MHILHIVGSISPEAGGPTEAIRMLIRYQPPGYTAEVATLNDPAEPFLASFPFQITALGSPRKKWYVPALTRWLKANRHRFDGVIVHGLWEYSGLAALRALKGHVPYVVFPHGMLDPYFKRTFPAKHMKKWLYWLGAEYWVLRHACRVLFTTSVERDLAAQSFWLHHWNAQVTAIGAEPPPHDPSVSIPAFYERCPEVRDQRFLLFLGRIDPKKGCDLLVEAFAATASLDPELHLVMAGPDAGNWRASLQPTLDRAGVAARVHWPGMLNGEAKWGAFAASEVFILPSHQENFGIAVAEALACGKPVLLSRHVNIAPDVEQDGCGFAEADTLAGTMANLTYWLTLDDDHRAAMSAQAPRTFAARYDMTRNAETILRVFEQACPAPHATPAEAH